MQPILIIKAGEKIASLEDVPGDFEDWIIDGLGVDKSNVRVVAVHQGELLPEPQTVSAVLITGSGAMVTDGSAWIESSAAWLREAVEQQIPTLGICFGHQLLGHALGGKVADNPNGIEVGTVTIEQQIQDDSLLGQLPRQFAAQLSHRQSVITLPPGARLLAASQREPHQAFAYGECAWGVQFHPEFSAEVVKRYIDFYRPSLKEQGDDADVLMAQTAETSESHSVLRRFAELW